MDSAWNRYRGRKIPASLTLWPVFDEHFKPGDRILDLGCGYGRTCRELYARGITGYYGLDLNPSGLKEARRWLAEEFPDQPRPISRPGTEGGCPLPRRASTGWSCRPF